MDQLDKIQSTGSRPRVGYSSMRVGLKFGLLVLLLALGSAVPAGSVRAQPVRSPELNLDYHRAEVAWRSGGSVLEAKARVDRVLAKIPDDVEALKLRSQVLMSLQRPDEALVDARKATVLNAADWEAQLILAEAAHAAGNSDLALVALGRASERVIDDAPSHVRMSWLAAELGRTGWAEAFARTALAQDDRDPAAYYQLARVFLRQDRRDDAAEIIARGLRSSLLNLDAMVADHELSSLLVHPTLSAFSR